MRGTSINKYLLFLFAYIPLYIIGALKSINVDVFDSCGKLKSISAILNLNILPCLMICLVLFLLIYFRIHEFLFLRAKGNPLFKIKSISSQNKEYITYLGTYVLPFIALETKTIFDVLAYVFLFLTMGFIYCRTNLIYTNPMLLFFGYEIFEITTDSDEKLICITKDEFFDNENPIGRKLDKQTYIISKWRKEN
ncbi:MAG: hypothetical protein IPP64_06705 [Bacteroidetes bacterium]|nr:hypothetical protein [Bacteroidota bacterium]